MFEHLKKIFRLKKEEEKIGVEDIEPVVAIEPLHEPVKEDDDDVGSGQAPRISKDYAPYNIKGVDETGEYFQYKNGRLSEYTVHDIVQVKEVLYDYNAFPDIKSFNSLLPFSNTVISRILWNVENGVYDEWLPQDSC